MKTKLIILGLLISCAGFGQQVYRLDPIDSVKYIHTQVFDLDRLYFKATVSAGPNDTITAGQTYQLAGTKAYMDSVVWTTSGTGDFDNDNLLTATYTPSAADITAGSVTLTLTGYVGGASTGDGMTLTIDPGIEYITFASEQPATINQVSITFTTLASTDTIYVDWGEGDVVKVSGTTDQTITSAYSTANTTYNIRIWNDIDKITKFYVYEPYVTFGDMSDNVGKMTGLTYLYMRDCSGVATAVSGNIPTGLTDWYWYNLPNLTATLTGGDIPTDLTNWYWYKLPNLTATLTGGDIPTGLTTWYWFNLPNLTATLTGGDIPTELTNWRWITLPNITVSSLSVSGLGKALTSLIMQAITLPTARVDELLASMNAYYTGANLMTENATITLDGTGVGAPTDGALNENIVSLINKATSQSKTWKFIITTP